jgi:uncharacterized protein
MLSISQRIAQELNAQEWQVNAAVTLLDEGATVPFIARYRKELTGTLDDTQLRTLQERLVYLRELEDRRLTVLKSIEEQGKLTPELKKDILEADTKTRLEDLYRPYMPKRRTKAQIAIEAGIEPLADSLLADPTQIPVEAARAFINAEKGFADETAVLEGARQILMEKFADNAELSAKLREFLWENGKLQSKVVAGKETEGIKFSDYFDAVESIGKIPSHRALAMFRGRTEGFLQLSLVLDENDEVNLPASNSAQCEGKVSAHFAISDKKRPADTWLLDTARHAWRVKIATRLDTELKLRLREAGENEAIKVFSTNLKDLLMAAPAGTRATMGLDPGFRTGVKIAVIDATGQLADTATIYPHEPQNQWQQSVKVIAALCMKNKVELIAIGNGTASRETDRLVADVIKAFPELKVTKVVVSEAGASVYSASSLAAEEFPDLDVSIRGAVSIARRLQDPLAELVKIDPKSIGVGQYQHDVNQTQLARSLEAVVEDCVNAVGVDVNTASIPLLSHISGLNSTLAKNIVEFRNKNGMFKNRTDLKKVPRLGEKSFEQSAGFLRIVNGENPLDGSSVHPEAYPVVERLLKQTAKSIKLVMGDSAFLRTLKAANFTDEKFGEPTVKDILAELEKPGRDPRPEFKTAEFKEGVETLNDLKPGMILEGAVTNVANFGAFVDIGVHQDGLVHISALSDKFVKDPRTVVKAGDVVKVKVLEVDVARKRISLTMRLSDAPAPSGQSKPSDARQNRAAVDRHQKAAAKQDTGMSALELAFKNAKR